MRTACVFYIRVQVDFLVKKTSRIYYSVLDFCFRLFVVTSFLRPYTEMMKKKKGPLYTTDIFCFQYRLYISRTVVRILFTCNCMSYTGRNKIVIVRGWSGLRNNRIDVQPSTAQRS